MRLRDAIERVDREHPELKGDDRLRAIKALRQEDKAARRRAKEADKEAGKECGACHQVVKPVEPSALVSLSVWLVLLVLASLGAALVAAVHTFDGATVHSGWMVVLWPVAAAEGWTHSKLLAVLLAFLAVVAVAWASAKLDERAKRKARCPKCHHRMTPPAQATPGPG
jgi:hypothetical protein